MQIKAILVDDEMKLLDVLKIKLKRFCPSVEVIGQALNADDAFKLISEKKPDLVFLDITMPGKSGFDLIEMFDTIFFQLIFITSHNDFVLRALRLSATDYLLKPLSTEELIKAVNKAQEKIEGRREVMDYKVLQHNLKNQDGQNKRIAIPGTDSYRFVDLSSIIRCEGWEKYTRIHIDNGEVIVSSYSIGIFKKLLKDNSFHLCHKSHLINTDHICEYLMEGTIIMSDNSSIPVSRRKREEFFDLFIRKK